MTNSEVRTRVRTPRPTPEQAEAALAGITMSVPETAVAIGRSEAMVRRGIEAGEIKVQRLGRNVRVLCAPLRRQLGIDH